jgi:putative NADH-flavin reductase
MSKIAVIGGTGYTGTHIVREAAARGHEVVSWSRSAPATPVEGVHYEYGDAAQAVSIIADADVLVLTLSPRGSLAARGAQLGLYQAFAETAARTGTRVIAVGGFSSLRPAPGEPRFAEGEIPEQYRDEALEGESIRAWFAEAAPAELDWTFVSPAAGYGAWAAGEKTGVYRVGGEVALFDAEGRSEISGADFADAVITEAEEHAHPRAHIGVAY